MSIQTQLLQVFRTDWSAANRLAVVIGAAEGAGLQQAHRLADDGFDLVIADTTAAVFRAGSTLMRAANRVTAQNFEPASIEDADRLLDAVGDRDVEVLAIHGDADAPGMRHLIATITEAMRHRGRGRILIDGREAFAAA